MKEQGIQTIVTIIKRYPRKTILLEKSYLICLCSAFWFIAIFLAIFGTVLQTGSRRMRILIAAEFINYLYI